MTVQACKALGADQVILVGTRQNRLDLGARLGADHVVNAREEDPVAAVKRLLGPARGRPGDRVLGQPRDPAAVRRDGQAGRQDPVPGVLPGPVTFDLSAAIRDDVTLYTTRGEGAAAVRRALSLAAQGKIRCGELVTHHFSLDDIQEGFRVAKERDGDPIKVVFVP